MTRWHRAITLDVIIRRKWSIVRPVCPTQYAQRTGLTVSIEITFLGSVLSLTGTCALISVLLVVFSGRTSNIAYFPVENSMSGHGPLPVRSSARFRVFFMQELCRVVAVNICLYSYCLNSIRRPFDGRTTSNGRRTMSKCSRVVFVTTDLCAANEFFYNCHTIIAGIELVIQW